MTASTSPEKSSCYVCALVGHLPTLCKPLDAPARVFTSLEIAFMIGMAAQTTPHAVTLCPNHTLMRSEMIHMLKEAIREYKPD